MTGERYKKLKKEIKQKIKKIKDYEIDDNKLAALVFIITAVLGIRAGNYLRLFVFEHETKKKRKEEEEYSSLYGEPELEEFEAPPDNESKWPDDPRAGIGAFEVSLFGKSKNRKFKKVALATLLGGGLGVGTGIYLRNNKIKKERKIEENKRKEIQESMKKNEEVYERGQKKLRESDAPESIIEEPRKKIEFDEKFDQINIPFEDDEDFGIKSDIESGTTGLQEEYDYYKAKQYLEEEEKKLKYDKKKTKKEKKVFSRNKNVNKRVNIIKEKIEENKKQSRQIENFYDNYFKQKEKRLSKKDLIRILSREEGEDKDDLKYYSYWELYKMYKEIMEKQKEISSVLDSDDDPVQEVMLFGKKKRNRRNKKRK